MNITFRQLRLFLALAETGSVSAAAKVMHVTQPTASMQLREVTQAVGVPLYEVVSRRVYLTEAGQALARTARAIAGEWDAFEQGISGAKGLTSGRLKVAVVSTAKYFVPRLLGSFRDLRVYFPDRAHECAIEKSVRSVWIKPGGTKSLGGTMNSRSASPSISESK